jgi:DNA-binding NarL/FixJ family response regulator
MSAVRVLVVDDSIAVRARVAAMIREVVGVSAVDEAGDGDEAIASARARRADLVVLDIHMPQRDGFAALPRLKALAPAPIVMVLTNDPSERHRRRCVLLGADLFFDKSKHFDRALEIVTDLAREFVSRSVRFV